jgi:hypothetical protein
MDRPSEAEGKARRHLSAAAFSECRPIGVDWRWGRMHREIAMKKLLVVAVIAASFFSVEAMAQERAGSAALGAVSGAVVLGPVGAVAGALIGYTAGPAIAHSWGVRRSASQSRVRRARQANAATHDEAAAARAPLPIAKPAEAAGNKAPPVQGFE